MSAFVDTNVLVRHLTSDPPELAARATAYLGTERELLLTDLVAAETVYVLESFYEVPRDQVAEAVRSLVAFDSIVSVDPALLLRATEVYETDRIDCWPTRRMNTTATASMNTTSAVVEGSEMTHFERRHVNSAGGTVVYGRGRGRGASMSPPVSAAMTCQVEHRGPNRRIAAAAARPSASSASALGLPRGWIGG